MLLPILVVDDEPGIRHILTGILEDAGHQVVTAGGATRTPMLAVTRRGDLRTKLEAFDGGVDDVMTMPLSSEELLARVLVITRRSSGLYPA